MKKEKSPKARNQGLKPMNFNVPPELYRRFKAKVARDGLKIREVAIAFLTAYIQGEFQLVEEKKADPKKG